MSELKFGAYASHTDPDDSSSMNLIGTRKTMRGAQSLVEKKAGRVYGYFARGNAYDTPILEVTAGEKNFRIVRGYYSK